MALDKKADNVVILDLKGLSSIADFFVICSGENRAQIRAIADSIDEHFFPKRRLNLSVRREWTPVAGF